VRALPGSIEVRELGTTDALAAGLADGRRGRVDAGASSHHVGADEVLALARELVGAEPRAFALGIGVADLELGEGLSPPVEAALPRVLDVVARLVADQRPA
jgi:Ni,Fe-hydrogenase maturation factor